ncbi:MAG: hypothetical protein HW416_574, partial [Chloroflexi bacterium]|nr:hypothetical protein [Chloroflexota bacterium]
MRRSPHGELVLLVFTLLLAACAPGAPQVRQGSSQPPAEQKRPGPKRIIAAIPSNPSTLSATILVANNVTPNGVEAVDAMVSAGLQFIDNRGVAHPQLAQEVPSTDNGLWKLLPDGRMETSWKIRPNAEWHDGTPFTAADIQFTWQLTQDRELVAFRHMAAAYDAIERIDAPDPQTVVIFWKRPFIYANLAWGFYSARPLYPAPKHLLEKPYLENKEGFYDLPHWSSEYVGTGPFKLKEWVTGSHLAVTANDRYVLGRPKLDEIKVRFIADPSTLTANFLAGAVNVNLGTSLSLDPARVILERIPGSKMDLAPTGVMTAYPQFMNPDPPILSDVRFRRGLIHALNRQEMVDTLMQGLSSVGHTFINPGEADYKDIESFIVKYDYDPRRAEQLFQELGLRKGVDGMYLGPTGQPIFLEIRTDRTELRQKTVLAQADSWKRAGIDAGSTLIPPQRERDAEYLTTYPAFEMSRRGNYRWSLDRVLLSNEAPTPENRYSGGNRGRYQNTELDRLVERHDTAIPYAERTQTLGQIVNIVSSDVVLMGMFYDIDP